MTTSETLDPATLARGRERTATTPASDRPAPDRRVGTEDELDSMFSAGATRYDLLVALNPGYRQHLRTAARELIERLRSRRSPRLRLLDLGCGSGVSTRELVAEAPAGSLVEGVDASSGMLAAAEAKRWPDGVGFSQRHAEDLAELDLPAQDGVLAAYLLRNVPTADRDQVCRAIHDSLRPGGWAVIQEYGLADQRARWVWHLVCWLVVIPLSTVVLRNPTLYRYLWRSVCEFEPRQRVMRRLTEAGFTDVAVRTVGGWQRGLLHIYVARRPG